MVCRLCLLGLHVTKEGAGLGTAQVGVGALVGLDGVAEVRQKEESKSPWLTLLCTGTPRFWLLSPRSLLPCRLALALSMACPLAGRSLERL